MQSFKAILFGSLTDVVGTFIFSMIYMIIVWVYLAMKGELSIEASEEDLIAVFMEHPWDYIAFFFGCLISFLAGYVTAKISKTNVYFCAGIVSCVSVAFCFLSGTEIYSLVFSLFLSGLTLVSVFLGAYVWLKRNTSGTVL